ncbi:hypothetical protein GLOIN_2v1786507 [Rhizophagus clarus]|uniref:CCHC-type domain-containing protein n=1 Tax=Rhizophagus clarus TaxID=94130 RepID=A0A8H3R5Q3_9GLOM|nr:hypothetical protein GLOIN_2v1786507 [Rhizophagus clarus]
MTHKRSARLANKSATTQPKVVVPVEKPIIVIPAPSIVSNTSQQTNQGASAKGPSITVKKEIMASKAKSTLAEEQATAKEKALTSNLETERSLASDLFAEKKDGPLEDSADHPVFKLRLDRITSKNVDNSVKKQTTFTCYASDSNEDTMVTDPPNQEDQQTHSNGLFKNKRQIQIIDQPPSDLKMDVDQKSASQQVNEQPVDQPEIITISDDEDSFVLIPKLFTVYTESNNLPHVRKTDKAHEVLKLLQHYPGFEYAKPAHQPIRQENGKNKLINIVKAIFSNEDSYNKVLQGKFHVKINEEDKDGNIIEQNTTFQFKSAMKEKPQKNQEEIDNEKERTIQVFDIPLYTEKKTIQNSFNANSVQRFYHKWSHFIGKEYVRVTPILLSEEQRDQRKQHSLRLSGLPIGTTAINLRPILDEMNAMTCFIPRNPFHYKPFTYAYVNFKNEEDKEIAKKKKFSIKQGKIDKPLFISDPNIKRNICNNCGNPDHLYAGCNIKKRTNRRNNTVKAAWKERTKLTAQNKNRSYAQVVKSNAAPTNPTNRNNAQNQNKNNLRGKNPAHNNKNTTTHSPNNNTSQHRGTKQVGPDNKNKNLSDKQQQYLHSLVDNLVKTLEVQITQQFSELRTHIDQFGSTINQFRKERDERLKNITASGILHSPVARSPTPSTSSPKNDKNEQNKRVRKDPAYDDSFSSEEEQIENMLHTQRTLVQKVDQATSGLQGMIEGALQNFLGFATSSTTEQQFTPLEDDEEYLPTDNEEEEADVESNIDA